MVFEQRLADFGTARIRRIVQRRALVHVSPQCHILDARVFKQRPACPSMATVRSAMQCEAAASVSFGGPAEAGHTEDRSAHRYQAPLRSHMQRSAVEGEANGQCHGGQGGPCQHRQSGALVASLQGGTEGAAGTGALVARRWPDGAPTSFICLLDRCCELIPPIWHRSRGHNAMRQICPGRAAVDRDAPADRYGAQLIQAKAEEVLCGHSLPGANEWSGTTAKRAGA
mmetsp:Transcript_129548/g.360937  ORF Transcript_129548/g.360937 Transcript_129548/m.360937 type:complete len:227 (+) Transcript_129548:292-972(+)